MSNSDTHDESTESNIIQQLQSARRESPLTRSEIETWVDRLTSLEDRVAHTRKTDPQLLTPPEAEVIVRYYGTSQTRREAANAMDMEPSTFDTLRYRAEDTLLAAEAGLLVMDEFRADIAGR